MYIYDKMDIVFVIDLQNPVQLTQRQQAFEGVKTACTQLNANCHHIQFENLDTEDATTLEVMYNADVALIDFSIGVQRNSLFYHLGVRESFGMRRNILTFNGLDTGTDTTKSLEPSYTSYPRMVYKEAEHAKFVQKLRDLIQDVEIQTKSYSKQKFLLDLQKARETLADNELSKSLQDMKQRLHDPNVMCEETVYNMLTSFREIQDYDSMVNIVDTLYLTSTDTTQIQTAMNVLYMYAFALNRRNKEGDREKALSVLRRVLENDDQVADIFCLIGRIYKDIFVESAYTDRSSLHNAIQWYRKGFEIQPNEYAGINLATLLVVDGKEFLECEELQHIGMVVNHNIGQKGTVHSLQDYWDVATYFEINILARNFGKASLAAECIVKLKPSSWRLKSTMGNVGLIQQSRKQPLQMESDESLLNFWIEYFQQATKSEMADTVKIPVLIHADSGMFIPSYITVNDEEGRSSLQIANLCQQCSNSKCDRKHKWHFSLDAVKSFSRRKQDDRCAVLCFHQDPEDFHIYFPNRHYREHFHDLVQCSKIID